MSDIYADMKKYVIPVEFSIIHEDHFEYNKKFENDYHTPFFMNHHASPLIRLPYYLSIERYAHTSIFATGLIIDKEVKQPMQSITDIEKLEEFPAQIIIMGQGQGNIFIYSLLLQKCNYKVVFENKYMLIIERGKK